MKKNLIILVLSLAILSVALFFAYTYYVKAPSSLDIQNNEYQQDAEPMVQPQENNPEDSVPQVQIDIQGAQTQGENNQGSFSVCLDKCGDNICQESDPDCGKSNLNCICPETNEDCPEDCLIR